MSYDVATKFAPGEVTPEQLKQHRLVYAAARQKEKEALWRYEAAYHAYSDALFECRKVRNVYEWAKHGMVQEPRK